MSQFGQPEDEAPRWLMAVVVIAAVVGVLVGIWIFGALT